MWLKDGPTSPCMLGCSSMSPSTCRGLSSATSCTGPMAGGAAGIGPCPGPSGSPLGMWQLLWRLCRRLGVVLLPLPPAALPLPARLSASQDLTRFPGLGLLCTLWAFPGGGGSSAVLPATAASSPEEGLSGFSGLSICSSPPSASARADRWCRCCRPRPWCCSTTPLLRCRRGALAPEAAAELSDSSSERLSSQGGLDRGLVS